MDAQHATLLLMARMAMADGEVSVEERAFLELMLPEETALETVLEEAAGADVIDLCQAIESYPDRFFVALRAAAMAEADHRIDPHEEALYECVVRLLDIEPEDRLLIEDSVTTLVPDPRVEELYRQSSFVRG